MPSWPELETEVRPSFESPRLAATRRLCAAEHSSRTTYDRLEAYPTGRLTVVPFALFQLSLQFIPLLPSSIEIEHQIFDVEAEL